MSIQEKNEELNDIFEKYSTLDNTGKWNHQFHILVDGVQHKGKFLI